MAKISAMMGFAYFSFKLLFSKILPAYSIVKFHLALFKDI